MTQAIVEPEIIDLTNLSESDSEGEGDSEEDEIDSEEKSDQGGSDHSDLEDVEVTINATSRERLHDAIGLLGEERLKQVLMDLVGSIPAVEESLTRQLLTLKRKTNDLIARWEKCTNCEDEFDMASRREQDECSFHPGELEVDEEQFVDWDENCHGPMDTPDNQRDFPENFKWTCCEENGRAEGCVHGVHRPLLRKRRRL